MEKLDTVAIVGAGTMGRRIAFGCVIAQVSARIYDVERSATEAAETAVRGLVQERIADGRLSTDRSDCSARHLTAVGSLEECVRGASIVIETVPENVDLKRKVFSQIDKFADPGATLLTNTSSIPGSRLADATGNPKQFLNVNFGTPDDLKVEVMGHPETSESSLNTTVAFLRKLGLVPVVALREIQGYPINRIWRAVKKEVLHLLDEGYSTPENIDRGWMLDWDTPIGPCGLMDKVGMDVVRDIEMVYYETTGDTTDKPPQLLLDMISGGKLGEKTGEGFYTYPNPAYTHPDFRTGVPPS